jgi:hypothetical protein
MLVLACTAGIYSHVMHNSDRAIISRGVQLYPALIQSIQSNFYLWLDSSNIIMEHQSLAHSRLLNDYDTE